MVNQLNAKFKTTVFELININVIPTRKMKISKLVAKVSGIEQDQKIPTFEKTQYPVVAFYELGAFLTSNTLYPKLYSSIAFFEFYGEGNKKPLRVCRLSDIGVGKNYEEYIDEMKQQEDDNIITFVKSEEKYFSKKVK